jgi:hypothetical protein
VSQPLPVQLLAAGLFVGILVLASIMIADDWSDYVIFGAVFVTFLGFAIAVNKRQYPTKKRGFSRDSSDRW